MPPEPGTPSKGLGLFVIAKQLGLEHVAGNRGAVERHERAIGAVGRAMDDAREHLLAGAGLAREEHRQYARGDPAAWKVPASPSKRIERAEGF